MRYAEEITILRQRGAPTGDVPRTRGGYALAVRCDRRHSGNARYSHTNGQWWECQECGDHVDGARLAREQREALERKRAEVRS